MIKEIVIESARFNETITITSKDGIDLYSGVVYDIIQRCKEESANDIKNLYSTESTDSDEESDSDSDSDSEIIEKHHYKCGCYCDTCKETRSQIE